MEVNPYEGLYKPVKDIDAYLKRIGCEKKKPSFEYLSQLMWGHLSNIPFEDLEVYEEQKTPSLMVDDLYDKFIVRKRGGYCFEQNGLFVKLLCGLGFDAYCVGVRIVRGKSFLVPIMHRGIIVKLDGKKVYTDVGFGGPCPITPIVLDEGLSWQQSGSRAYRAEYHGNEVHLYCRDGKEEFILFRFLDMALDEVDFISPNLSTSVKGSGFASRRIVNLMTNDGFRQIEGMTYTEKSGDNTIKEELDEETLTKVLKDKFGLVR